ncbi:hypothetical protein JCM5353_001916 [Sporobolomyces roseus]
MARTKNRPRPRTTEVRRTQPQAISRPPPPLLPYEIPTRDCFSSLPHEIIQTIVDMAQDKKLALPLANRSLLPFYRALMYRRVKINSTRQLHLFTRTLASNPALGRYVVNLEIKKFGTESIVGTKQAVINLDQTRLQAAFERLLTCRTIIIDGSSEVIAAFLQASRKCTSSPTYLLSLKGDFSMVDDPFDVGHYRCFKAVEMVVITVERSRRLDTPQEASPEHHPEAVFPLVNFLSLEGPLTSYFSTYRLLSRFSPKTLRLTDRSHLLPLPSLLAFLPKPGFTEIISLSGSDPYCSFARALRPFTSLSSLNFGGYYSASLEDFFYSALRKLPIKCLVFKQDCALDTAFLTELLHGRLQHPTLRRLNLDGEPAVEGSEIDFEEYNDWTTDWEVPGMNDDGSLDGTHDEMKRLVKKAGEGGIKIGGNVIETLEVQEKWIRRFERARDKFEGYGTSEDEDSEGSDSD